MVLLVGVRNLYYFFGDSLETDCIDGKYSERKDGVAVEGIGVGADGGGSTGDDLGSDDSIK